MDDVCEYFEKDVLQKRKTLWKRQDGAIKASAGSMGG